MSFVQANGITVGYEVDGAGPPLIALHGATSSGREDFAAQLPGFRAAFRMYLPDARGHATTRWDVRDGWTIEMLATDVIAFADALGIRTFHLLGFSMGGHTALEVAHRWPDRLRTIVIAGCGLPREPRLSVARRLFDPARIERDDPAWSAMLSRRHDPVQGVGAWQRLLPAIAAEVAAQPIREPAEIRAISAPTLVAVGDQDPFVPVGQAWDLARQLPRGQLFVAPACPHEIMSRKPALFNEACAGFYRGTEAIARERSGTVGHSG